MKRCLIILISFYSLFNRLYGQSPSAAIDSLVKYRIITAKERPALEKEFRDHRNKSRASYRIAILAGLENIILKKTFHIDPHKVGLSYSYSIKYPNKNRDSVNTSLHLFLEKIRKAGLLTDRVYTYTLKGIDTGRYVADLQVIASLTEMSSRLESLAPNRLLPIAAEFHKNGIVSDSSFIRMESDIKNNKIESVSQLIDYCRLGRTFDLHSYPDDPDLWLRQLHRDIATMVPGLNFTDFSYTTIPDTSFTVPGVRFRVSLICNGRNYKYTSLAISNFRSRQGKITPRDIFIEDFHRIFNKILTDQQSPLRLHSVMFTPGETNDDHFRYVSLIALSETQAEVFMKKSIFSYISVSMNGYDNTLTSTRIDTTIAGWKKIGLFAHLSNAELSKAIDRAEADNLISINELLRNFPGVIYSLDSAFMNSHYPYPYGNLLSHFARITHGVFKPTKVSQRRVKRGVKLQYLSNGKIHTFMFRTANGWWDLNFPAFIQGLGHENNLPGNFYHFGYSDAVIYLTKQQYDNAIKYKLLDFEPVRHKQPPVVKSR